MKILLSWSSGKDSAWALHMLNLQYPGAVQALLTTVNEAVDRVAMHAVRRDVLEAQARAAGLPLVVVPIPHPCPNEVYEARMRVAVAAAVAAGFTHVAFGDLFLEDVRRYRVERLAGTGLEPLFPVWGIPTDRLAERDVEQRSARADGVRRHARFSTRPSSAASSIAVCSTICRPASTRAARTASSTPASTPARCSQARSPSSPARSSPASRSCGEICNSSQNLPLGVRPGVRPRV